MEHFKKGQIVPKRLKLVEFAKSRHRHTVVFGADVVVDGRTIEMLSDGCVFHLKKGRVKRRKNGPTERVFSLVHDVHISACNKNRSAFFVL